LQFTVDPYENLIQMPSLLWCVMEGGSAGFSDFCCNYWPEPIPPNANRFIANIDASFMQKVFDLT